MAFSAVLSRYDFAFGDTSDPGAATSGGQFTFRELLFGDSVPAVSEWGLIAMTLLVLTAGTLVLAYPRRRTGA